MTRDELLQNAKPILFNTEMVKAILDNRKSCTRRIVKGFIPEDAIWGYTAFTPKGYISCRGTFADGYGEKFFKLPCKKGDILYVRETYCWCPCWDCGMDTEDGCCDKTASRFYSISKKEYGCYGYRASFDDNEEPFDRWYPSIHMPKAAARIFLKVLDVRVERLQDITEEQAKAEGCNSGLLTGPCTARGQFESLWNSTIKKSDIDSYGYVANPYVFVIEFELIKDYNG